MMSIPPNIFSMPHIFSMPRRVLCLAVAGLCAGGAGWAQKIPLAQAAQRSAEVTTLTAPGSPSFHLSATLASGGESGMDGTIEEYWVSAKKWRRTLRTPDFSQTTIVNGGVYYEKDEGDYYPASLRVLVQALLQPMPEQLVQALSQSKVKLNLFPGAPRANVCDENQMRTGVPPAVNSIMVSVCFAGDPPAVSSIRGPGYDVVFKDREAFGELMVAMDVISGSSPETKWEARMDDLSPLTEIDETLFAAPENTPEARRLGLVLANEEEARQIFKKLPDLDWPAVHQGRASGVVTVYVSTDATGHVREAWPLSSDNLEIGAAACAQVLNWNLGTRNPAEKNYQMETYFTFAFPTPVAGGKSK
jgi:hypothetical protein